MNISEVVTNYVKHHQMGAIFTHKQVVERVGGHSSRVSQSLRKLEEADFVVQIDRGLWQRPKSTRFGVVLASPEQVVAAIAKQRNAFLVDSGAKVLNEIGASTQIPMKSVYTSNKRIKPIRVGKRTIEFKYSRPFEAAVEALSGLSSAEKKRAAKLWVALEFAEETLALREKRAFLKAFGNLTPKAQEKLLSALKGKLKWARPMLEGSIE